MSTHPLSRKRRPPDRAFSRMSTPARPEPAPARIATVAAGAREAWEQGLVAAQAHGDKQAEKEMDVFLRKLDKAQRP